MQESYQETIALIERLHRQLLDLLTADLDASGLTQLNNVQALLLYNIGDAEMTAGELRTRGHYLGSNVSYNLKKLVDLGYIHHQRSEADRRSVRVRLTPAGQRVCQLVSGMFARQYKRLCEDNVLREQDLNQTQKSLSQLEGYWHLLLRRPD